MYFSKSSDISLLKPNPRKVANEYRNYFWIKILEQETKHINKIEDLSQIRRNSSQMTWDGMTENHSFYPCKCQIIQEYTCKVQSPWRIFIFVDTMDSWIIRQNKYLNEVNSRQCKFLCEMVKIVHAIDIIQYAKIKRNHENRLWKKINTVA